MRPTPSRTLLTVGLATMGLIMAAGPAAAHPAGDGEGHRGKVGRHAFVDSEKRPGVRCLYAPVEPTTDKVPVIVGELVGVGVRPPKVAAIDRTDRVDRQRVGWRFILQERIGKGAWTAVKRSPLQIRRTSDKKAAQFSRMRIRYDGNPEADYRVKTKAYWFKPRLRRIGVATHLVDYYAVRGGVTKGSCRGASRHPRSPKRIPVPVAPSP
ncbi:MAG: hypothetical protein ACC726_01520 [Chloroflexota bacterium]